jgi:hypothetical protein
LNRYLYKHIKLHLTKHVQLLILLAATAFVLYAVLFTTIPAAHNFFHETRHALSIIGCH